MRRRRTQGKTWGDAHIVEHPDGTIVHCQRKYVGYGFSEYQIVGTLDGVKNQYELIQKDYPPQGYGGHYPEPVEIATNLWLGTPRHMLWLCESCD